jgi:hypothetical protein
LTKQVSHNISDTLLEVTITTELWTDSEISFFCEMTIHSQCHAGGTGYINMIRSSNMSCQWWPIKRWNVPKLSIIISKNHVFMYKHLGILFYSNVSDILWLTNVFCEACPNGDDKHTGKTPVLGRYGNLNTMGGYRDANLHQWYVIAVWWRINCRIVHSTYFKINVY